MIDSHTLSRLVDAARAAAERAYAPYSRFRVGAALLDSAAQIHAGCNVENISYGLTICAERNAVAAAVLAGVESKPAARRLIAGVVYTPTPTPTPPCGACRQVLAEFNPDLEMWLSCEGGQQGPLRLRELLPLAFDSLK